MRSLLCPFLIVAAASACTTTKSSIAPEPAAEQLHFIEDDYARAVSMAKSGSLPIFVDVWAPW